MKTNIVLTLVVIVAAILLSTAAKPAPASTTSPSRLNLYVSTVVWTAGAEQHVASFIDVMKTKDEMNLIVGSRLGAEYPGAKIVSLKTDQVSDDLLEKLVRSRSRRAF